MDLVGGLVAYGLSTTEAVWRTKDQSRTMYVSVALFAFLITAVLIMLCRIHNRSKRLSRGNFAALVCHGMLLVVLEQLLYASVAAIVYHAYRIHVWEKDAAEESEAQVQHAAHVVRVISVRRAQRAQRLSRAERDPEARVFVAAPSSFARHPENTAAWVVEEESKDSHMELGHSGQSPAMESCCSVCLETIELGVRSKVCGHKFHAYCIGRWTERKATCPVCRARIPPY